MLRHTFVTTMLDAGVNLRDVQIASRHDDPRTTMRHDPRPQEPHRHPNYVLTACIASGTQPKLPGVSMSVPLPVPMIDGPPTSRHYPLNAQDRA